jgi:2-amino-4-hydroxy-6-hydroxymethyldihydropteridine diphosphokinase
VVVGIGANVGDRIATMRAALERLARVAKVERVSRVYETAPVGGPPQPDYLNAAALVSFEGDAEALLDALLAIEHDLGRTRRADQKNAPRTIDLDVLWINGVALATDRLVVPHPRLRERAFALVPLLDVVPDAIDPRSGERLVAPHGDVRATALTLER